MALRDREISLSYFHKIPCSVQFSPPAEQSFQLSIPGRSRQIFQDLPIGFYKRYMTSPLQQSLFLQ